jgi:hypothetical protein
MYEEHKTISVLILKKKKNIKPLCTIFNYVSPRPDSPTFSLKEIPTDKAIITLPPQQSNQPFGTSQSLNQIELSNKTLVQSQPSSSTTNIFKAHKPITTSPGPNPLPQKPTFLHGSLSIMAQLNKSPL